MHTEQFNGRSYAPNKAQIIKSTGSRLRLNVISSLAKDSVMRFMTSLKSMNFKIFIKFMKQLITSSSCKKVFFIVDNLRVHHGKIV
ncbi:MAG: transposase [Deltaproteobacteria bacterium]|nr:transposase [Deltaproteobacteria bacterium]